MSWWCFDCCLKHCDGMGEVLKEGDTGDLLFQTFLWFQLTHFRLILDLKGSDRKWFGCSLAFAVVATRSSVAGGFRTSHDVCGASEGVDVVLGHRVVWVCCQRRIG